MQLSGSTVLLTGATGGIGQAIARMLHARGAKLILTGRRAEVLDQLQEELGGSPRQLPADLTTTQDALDLAEFAGDVDVLVANAALPASGAFDSFEVGQLDRALDVNLRAPAQLALALLPGMLERGQGHLVFVSSLSGKIASGGAAVYSATKFGLRGLAGGMREDFRDRGVGVTSICPGFIRDAGMFADSGATLPRFVGSSTPQEVADAVVLGIERDKGEIDVAPFGMRAGARFALVAPGLSARVQRRFGADKIAADIAAGQQDKR
jgi:short-subunit dehydrogenase